MTAAPFIAFACASSLAAEPEAVEVTAEIPAVHGAGVADRGAAALRIELGMAGALPTALIGGATGLAPRVDLGAHAVTHAGLAHALGATVRWRFAEATGLGLTLDDSFFTVEQLAGIEASRAPFGNRTAATLQLLHTSSHRGMVVGWSGGFELGVIRTVRGPAGSRRAIDPALDTVWGEVAATWPREQGAVFVRFRAIVPVARQFHVLGYLPHVAVGRSWSVR
jgi:hypothetical protein